MSRANVTSGGEDPSAAPGGSQWGGWGGLGALSGVCGGAVSGPALACSSVAEAASPQPSRSPRATRRQFKRSGRPTWSIGQLVVQVIFKSMTILLQAKCWWWLFWWWSSWFFSLLSTQLLTPSVSPSEVKFYSPFFFSQNQSFPFQCCPQSQCFLLNLGITRIRHFQPLCQIHFRWKPIISNPYDLFSVQNSIQSLWDLTFSDNNVPLCNS